MQHMQYDTRNIPKNISNDSKKTKYNYTNNDIQMLVYKAVIEQDIKLLKTSIT